MVNVHFNSKGIGDVLLVSVDAGEVSERCFEKKGDVVKLFDKKDGRTLGYNIFNASQQLDIHGEGKLDVDEDIINSINALLGKNGIEDQVNFDSRPEFIVGHVVSKEKHPDADKLSLCTVDIGGEHLQIVCGAPNIEQNQKVVVARVGAVMPGGTLIKEAELRGVKSYGMICSAKELNLPDAPKEKGILILDDSYKIGEDYFKNNQ